MVHLTDLKWSVQLSTFHETILYFLQFEFAFSIMKVQVVTKFWVYVQALRALNFFERSMRCMSNVNRKYKDRVFKFIFGNPENKAWTLSLYNAVNG